MPPPPPVREGFTRVNVVGNLYVDIQGAYPDGYGAKWSGVGTQTTVPISQTWYVNRGETKSTIQQYASLAAPEGSGRAQFAFNYRDKPCYGDITGTDGPVLLTEAPQTFRVTDLHVMTPNRISGCAFTNTANNFAEIVTLSADSQGNVYLQYAINVFNAQGAQQYLWEAPNFQLKNNMTPQMAVADIEKKKQAALAEQKRVEEARALMAARQARRDKLTGLARLADQTIDQDSRNWLVQRYDIGSVVNVKTLASTAGHAPSMIYAEYTFNNGSQGWVKIALSGKDSVKCVQFWNESACRGLGHPQSIDVATHLAVRAMEDSMTSSSSNCQMELKFIDNNGKRVMACK